MTELNHVRATRRREGYGRKAYIADYQRFLVIALASNDETREWLRYVEDCHPEHAPRAVELGRESNEIGRMLTRLIQALATSH